jgi:hypothetical protein
MEEKLKQREGENRLAYIKRITENKDIMDLDYSEWGFLICGKQYSSENCRKAFYILKPMLKTLDEETINKIENNVTGVDEIINELELKRIEIEKEKIKIQSIKSEYSKWLRQDARLEMFFEEVKKSIETIEVPEFSPITIDKNKSKIGLLGISDFHFGKIFYSINNQYSEETFYERMNKLITETVELCKEQNIEHLHVLNCGDDVEGMTLRISQLASLQSGLTDQTIKVARYMAKFLNELSKYITITYHHVLCGNHSEIRAFSDKSFTFENMERIIIEYLHDVLENNPRIIIPIYKGKYVDFKIFDYNIYAQHGQKVKNPKTIIASASQLHRKFYDIAYFGHLHHDIQMTTNESETHDCEVIYIQSLMGSDEYSDDNYFGGAKAGAKFDVYEEGKCRKASFKIILN